MTTLIRRPTLARLNLAITTWPYLIRFAPASDLGEDGYEERSPESRFAPPRRAWYRRHEPVRHLVTEALCHQEDTKLVLIYDRETYEKACGFLGIEPVADGPACRESGSAKILYDRRRRGIAYEMGDYDTAWNLWQHPVGGR